MITNLPHPLMPFSELPTANETNWHSSLFEPVLVVGACLFWLVALPVTGLFCATVALYDKVASLRTQQFRLPDLRHSGTNNPLLLRTKSTPQQPSARANGPSRAFQS